MEWWVRSATRAGMGLVFLWMASCGNQAWWSGIAQPEQCDPSSQPKLAGYPLWQDQDGRATEGIFGCLRIAWDDDGRSLPVELRKDGKLRSFQPQSQSYELKLSFTLPAEARNQSKSFWIFFFPPRLHGQRGLRHELCGQMQKPSYQCLEDDRCGFAMAFRPQYADGTLAPAIPGAAASASCHFIARSAPQEAGDEPKDSSADAPADAPQEQASQDNRPDAPASDQRCTPASTRACYTESVGCTRVSTGKLICMGTCKAGVQRCEANGQWGSCEGQSKPSREICDQKDNNCDGKVDENLPGCQPACKAPCVDTLAGSKKGFDNGKGPDATFDTPKDLAANGKGEVIVVDTNNHALRKISGGEVSTFAGDGNPGSNDGKGDAARFRFPHGIALAPDGNYYVADTDNHVIRLVDPQGVVSRFAGQVGMAGHSDGLRLSAQFKNPERIAADARGNLYISDTGNHVIRKIDAQGNVTTLAGKVGAFGKDDGTGTAARFDAPKGIAVDAQGNVYVADSNNHKIRKITPAGEVTSFAGTGVSDHLDGKATDARFHKPEALAIAADGALYIADTFNTRIRKYDPKTQAVTTIAGTSIPDFRDDTALKAQFDFPRGVALGANAILYIADTDNHRIRRLLQE